MNRRGFLGGLAAALATPAIIRTPGLLMPVKRVEVFEFSVFYSLIPLGQFPSDVLFNELMAITRKAFISETWDWRTLAA